MTLLAQRFPILLLKGCCRIWLQLVFRSYFLLMSGIGLACPRFRNLSLSHLMGLSHKFLSVPFLCARRTVLLNCLSAQSHFLGPPALSVFSPVDTLPSPPGLFIKLAVSFLCFLAFAKPPHSSVLSPSRNWKELLPDVLKKQR